MESPISSDFYSMYVTRFSGCTTYLNPIRPSFTFISNFTSLRALRCRLSSQLRLPISVAMTECFYFRLKIRINNAVLICVSQHATSAAHIRLLRLIPSWRHQLRSQTTCPAPDWTREHTNGISPSYRVMEQSAQVAERNSTLSVVATYQAYRKSFSRRYSNRASQTMTRNPKSSPQPHTADEMPLVFTSTHSLLRTSKALRHSYARALKAATLAGRVQKVIVEVIGSDFSLARSEFLSKLDASSRALYNANTCNAAPYSAMPCITIRLNYIEGLRLPDRPANVKEWVEWCLEEKTAGREVFCSYRWCVRTGGDGYRKKTPALDWKSAGVS